ncbi:hypothetical protein MPTK1_4g22930 [Marchantia polymorpha subsp. ruderalis]|uniref:Uncharacterized protein n=2 Tax=Marchantia polymorpha TaxID=3197 RepID=A0AAF6BCT1_MARPO|nr:hypothetical protein MARPO_0020s0055 [Marchantia polymorpha]BBN09813.1 hypothetical protein Mp_4g22930 [Marchantia polymorpha subsp. ruderalis]PTQ44389.1 hypothetical protein MARPO_0020s0055 [Marchantia polymorpha]PTQ44390.1 hypothetical protein MARPO_0020s0055 [Marchantia polymorpha]BBN09814.1 hypothetical protein Mp_4g22930 [Marchantia polymorpha subsp. ruderalis]|eukprot:PTQ44388.1 hypothetical protein MARPO_0020s0055 [Marchantia polymorpha]
MVLHPILCFSWLYPKRHCSDLLLKIASQHDHRGGQAITMSKKKFYELAFVITSCVDFSSLCDAFNFPKSFFRSIL